MPVVSAPAPDIVAFCFWGFGIFVFSILFLAFLVGILFLGFLRLVAFNGRIPCRNYCCKHYYVLPHRITKLLNY